MTVEPAAEAGSDKPVTPGNSGTDTPEARDPQEGTGGPPVDDGQNGKNGSSSSSGITRTTRSIRLKVIRSRLWQKEPWQNYGLAVLFIGVVPLLPLIIEWLGRREISEDAVIITVAVYSVTVALASNNRFFFGFLLLSSIVVASMYGFAADPSRRSHEVISHILGIRTYSFSTDIANNNWTFSSIILISLLSVLFERFSRHVRYREEFFEFLKSKKGGG